MKDCFEMLRRAGIVPVVTAESPDGAALLASALVNAELPVAEITFRTEAAPRFLSAVREADPSILAGAGTVLTERDFENARAAGAAFIVSPGFNPKLAEACRKAEIPYIPGVMTPTEIEAALGMGFSHLKFFPAEAAGGVGMLKAFSAPYRSVRFMPTGGISLKNAREYLSLPCVFCCGGSFVADEKSLAAGDFLRIEERAREAVRLVRSVRGEENDHA